MPIISLAVLLTGLGVGPAAAQNAVTLKDAAFGNVAALTRLCADVMLRRAQNGAAFTQAGFTCRAVDRGINSYGIHRGTGHYFDAPAQTAHAQVDAPDRPAGICTVYTRHLTQPETNALIGATLRQFYPAAQQRSAASWSIPTPGGLPLLLSITTIANNNRYEPPGTIRVSMSYPG